MLFKVLFRIEKNKRKITREAVIKTTRKANFQSLYSYVTTLCRDVTIHSFPRFNVDNCTIGTSDLILPERLDENLLLGIEL